METIDLKALRVLAPSVAAWIDEAEDLIKQAYWGEGWIDKDLPRLDALLKAIEYLDPDPLI